MVSQETGSKFYPCLIEYQKDMLEPQCLFVELLGMLPSVFPLTRIRTFHLFPEDLTHSILIFSK